uniref:C3H1-type domain-containing protein n=1 Tax=Macrostomum lignano TaxID=282301 RepID=A0A1I8FL69_9PLAT
MIPDPHAGGETDQGPHASATQSSQVTQPTMAIEDSLLRAASQRPSDIGRGRQADHRTGQLRAWSRQQPPSSAGSKLNSPRSWKLRNPEKSLYSSQMSSRQEQPQEQPQEQTARRDCRSIGHRTSPCTRAACRQSHGVAADRTSSPWNRACAQTPDLGAPSKRWAPAAAADAAQGRGAAGYGGEESQATVQLELQAAKEREPSWRPSWRPLKKELEEARRPRHQRRRSRICCPPEQLSDFGVFYMINILP